MMSFGLDVSLKTTVLNFRLAADLITDQLISEINIENCVQFDSLYIGNLTHLNMLSLFFMKIEI